MELTPQFLVMLLRMATELRTYMMNYLTDADLAVRIPGNPSLGELCREMGNVERAYLDSYRTLTMRFDVERDDRPETAAHVETLKAWYQALDAEFEAVLMALPESEFPSMMIERSGRQMPAGMHYHTYHEAILIFCARCSVYLRMLDKPLNAQWLDWIG